MRRGTALLIVIAFFVGLTAEVVGLDLNQRLVLALDLILISLGILLFIGGLLQLAGAVVGGSILLGDSPLSNLLLGAVLALIFSADYLPVYKNLMLLLSVALLAAYLFLSFKK